MEVEVSYFVVLGYSQKLSENLIDTDDSAVVGVLEVVLTYVLGDFLGYCGSCHFSSLGYTYKLSHLVTDSSGLGETTGLSVGVLALLSGLLGCLDFAFTSRPEVSYLCA